MRPDYDALVLGGGNNSLVAAARLAKDGFSVALITEGSGLGAEMQTKELIPGFRFNVGPLDGGLFENELIAKLGLSEFGLRILGANSFAFAPQIDGPGLSLQRDINKSQESIAQFSVKDAEIFAPWLEKMGSFASQIAQMAQLAPPSLRYSPPSLLLKWARMALGLRMMGGVNMMEFLRVLPMGATRLLNETFESEALKGLLLTPAIKDLLQGPRAAGTAFNFLYHLAGAQAGNIQRSIVFKGGSQSLVDALKKRCAAEGVDFILDAGAYRIQIKNYRASGIKISTGEIIQAKTLLSGMEARRTFLDFVGPTKLEPRFVRRLLAYKLKGSTASIHLALSALPKFSSPHSEEELIGNIVICPNVDYAEKAFDAAKYGDPSANPVLDARISSLLDPSLSPHGQHSMSVHYLYAPYDLRGKKWAEQKERLLTNALATLENYAPGFKSLVLGAQVITPEDYEREYGLSEGSFSHGQMSLDQLLLMRPVPGFAGYRSPVDGLYLCGPSAHPGGGGSGTPGWNAARQAIREL